MKVLKDILYTVPLKAVKGDTYSEISAIQFDSRKVEKGDLFVAVKGTQADGHEYISLAIEKGAKAIMCEVMPQKTVEGITYLEVENSSKSLAIAAANYYDNPSQKITLVGVTGTNGKTTVATLLYQLFSDLGNKCGLLSTVRILIDDREQDATHTTPDAISIQKTISNMVEAGCNYCFMEVSSHAIVQNRVQSLDFDAAVFTNISHDHLDYHGTFANYINAKKKLFDGLSEKAFAIVNKDDKRYEVMLQNTSASKVTFSLQSMADFKLKILEDSFSGLVLSIDGVEFHSLLVGEFNAYNLLSAYATAVSLGVSKTQVLTALSKLRPADGRFEYIMSPNKGIIGIVDYAHTPDALKKVLETINKVRTRNETLITVIGCGGNRDKAKRPMMAKIAAMLSDKVILTSDNPRDEDPEAILKDMLEGVTAEHKAKLLKIIDREEAIKTATQLAQKSDIILVAGKGHEKYQEIKGKRIHFDDKAILQESFKLLQS